MTGKDISRRIAAEISWEPHLRSGRTRSARPKLPERFERAVDPYANFRPTNAAASLSMPGAPTCSASRKRAVAARKPS